MLWAFSAFLFFCILTGIATSLSMNAGPTVWGYRWMYVGGGSIMAACMFFGVALGIRISM